VKPTMEVSTALPGAREPTRAVALLLALAPRTSLLPLAVPFYGVMLAIALAVAHWSGDALMYARPPVGDSSDTWGLTDAVLGMVIGLAVIVVSRQFTRRTQWGAALADVLADAIGKPGVAECIVLAVVSGIGEEALFRGALQPHVGLWAASLIFGLAHFAPRRELWPWTLFAMATGLLLGASFEWTGNLVAPIVAHTLINAVNLRLLALRDSIGSTA